MANPRVSERCEVRSDSIGLSMPHEPMVVDIDRWGSGHVFRYASCVWCWLGVELDLPESREPADVEDWLAAD